MDSDQDAGGGAVENMMGDEGTDDENDMHGDELLSSLTGHKAQIAEALLQGQGDDLAVVTRWFTFNTGRGRCHVPRIMRRQTDTVRTKA